MKEIEQGSEEKYKAIINIQKKEEKRPMIRRTLELLSNSHKTSASSLNPLGQRKMIDKKELYRQEREMREKDKQRKQ